MIETYINTCGEKWYFEYDDINCIGRLWGNETNDIKI